jgi:hypothetical protein
MAFDGHKLVRFDGSAKGAFGHSSASLLQSLVTASMLVIVAALLALAAGATMYYGHVAWYINVGTILAVETLAAIVLATIALERTRKRSIRRTLELAFVNHHVNNALAQIAMASDVTDIAKKDRYLKEAVSRISEALFRTGNGSDLATLALDVDLGGKDLNRGRDDRESKWLARGA